MGESILIEVGKLIVPPPSLSVMIFILQAPIRRLAATSPHSPRPRPKPPPPPPPPSQAARQPATAALALALAAVFALLHQRRLGYADVGMSYDSVVRDGQAWRCVSSQLSHLELVHLVRTPGPAATSTLPCGSSASPCAACAWPPHQQGAITRPCRRST